MNIMTSSANVKKMNQQLKKGKSFEDIKIEPEKHKQEEKTSEIIASQVPPILYLSNKSEDGFEGDILSDFYMRFP